MRLRKSGRSSVSLLLVALLILLASACQHQRPRFTVEGLPAYEALFRRSSGWTGGDGAFSTALGPKRFLWLFGDTFIGKVMDHRHVDAVLVHNTLAIQVGKNPESASIAFYYGHSAQGKPVAFVRPCDGVGWFWPYQAVRTNEGLSLFLIQIEGTDASNPFGFKPVATWLGQVGNPGDPPDHWKIRQRKIPWSNQHRLFGSSILIEGKDCYIFGTVDEISRGVLRKPVILARVPAEDLADFSRWRFYSAEGWVADAERAGRLCEDVANEFSVSFQPALNRYLMLYTQSSFSDTIVFRLAPEPYGPWGEPIPIYRCPEARPEPRLFCYAAKGHPELALSPEELIVTYLTNSNDLALIESDAGLYRPRFLRLRFRAQ
jgi:Domain of unknown function (DUF4185)